MIIPFLGLIAGFLVVYQLPVLVPFALAPYLAVAVLATLDTVLGGIRAGLDHKFETDIFVSGFFLNAILAWMLAYIGDHQVGVDLKLVATIVFGYRIFQNLSLIRTHWIASHRRRRPPSTDGNDPSVSVDSVVRTDAAVSLLDSGGGRRVA